MLGTKTARAHATGAFHSRIIEKRITAAKIAKIRRGCRPVLFALFRSGLSLSEPLIKPF
jgi:hypothetical protein